MIGEHYDTSTNLGDNEKINTAALKAVRPMNTWAGTLVNSLIVICKVCTSPFSPTDEKCKACGVARALQGESGLSSTQELSVSDSGNMASSFGVITDPRTKLMKQSTPTGFRVSVAIGNSPTPSNPTSQGYSPSDELSNTLDLLSFNSKSNEADNADTRENNGATSQFQEGDRVQYKETQMIVVQKARKHVANPDEQYWMIKNDENTKSSIRVKAKNMTKIDPKGCVGVALHLQGKMRV